MVSIKKHPRWFLCLAGMVCLIVFAAFFSACGGGASMNSASTGSEAAPGSLPAKSASGSSTNGQGQAVPSNSNVMQQYLIKSLTITMNVKDTRQVATQLQAWITATDPRSSSAGANYTETDTNQYTVSLTFSVEATDYPAIYDYLRDYTVQHGGQLVNFTESVQDVTNDYIDTQSRLKNLRGEQQRLLTLLGQAQTLNDVLNIEQRLTDVEGQIEDIEAHLNALNGQVTFYTVAITLQPVSSATPAPATNTGGWSAVQVWQGAVSAVTAVTQVLVTLFIWLLVFSVYIIPVACFALGVRWFRKKRLLQRVVPKMAPTVVTSPPSQSE